MNFVDSLHNDPDESVVLSFLCDPSQCPNEQLRISRLVSPGHFYNRKTRALFKKIPYDKTAKAKPVQIWSDSAEAAYQCAMNLNALYEQRVAYGTATEAIAAIEAGEDGMDILRIAIYKLDGKV